MYLGLLYIIHEMDLDSEDVLINLVYYDQMMKITTAVSMSSKVAHHTLNKTLTYLQVPLDAGQMH